MNEFAHNYGDSAGFLREYQAWYRGTQYFRGLVRPESNKSIAGIASMVDIKQEKLERKSDDEVFEDIEESMKGANKQGLKLTECDVTVRPTPDEILV